MALSTQANALGNCAAPPQLGVVVSTGGNLRNVYMSPRERPGFGFRESQANQAWPVECLVGENCH